MITAAEFSSARIWTPGIIPARNELRWLLRNSRAPKIRTMRQFAEQEISIPEGPHRGKRFRVERQPFTGLWLAEVDRGEYRWFATTGPSQSGKTMISTMVPLLYHLFEIGETVGFALPDMDMAHDKWVRDIRPVLERTRYRNLMPTEGEGARGGKVKNMVQFRNGSALKFFSAGGGDKGRAGFTCRVLIVTEANAFGARGEASDEANKLEQIVARTKSFGERARVYIECTVDVETGIIWQQYKTGTRSRIAGPCPHCQQWVTPEREHLVGWQDATDVKQARASATFVCPSCQHPIDETERRAMNLAARLLHGDQSIDPETGELVGDPPPTETLGFRWSGFHNQFVTAGDLAVEEWNATRDPDEESAQKKLSQFIWCLPYTGDTEDSIVLDSQALVHRIAKWKVGIVPAETILLTAGVDLGKFYGHYVVLAWFPDGGFHVVEYNTFHVPSDEFGEERAVYVALYKLRDEVMELAWPIEGTGEIWKPEQIWVDARYQTDAVYAFMREMDQLDPDRWRPTMGHGTGRHQVARYSRPKSVGKHVIAIGEGYHFTRDAPKQVTRVDVDADHWKTFVHARLAVPMATPRAAGCATLYHVVKPQEHMKITKHWTAERQVREYIAGVGEEVRWERVRRNNHWLDATAIGSAAAHFGGVRLIETKTAPLPASEEPAPQFTTPDGRAFFVLNR